MSDDRHWYRSAVFYEVLARSFGDADGDGVGDLRGLTDRLEYLEWLGVDCLWLPPIFDSPLRDGGYDIRDYYAIHPDVGTVDDMADLLDAAHRRGIRVISDLVVNHTSDEHAWFQEARRPGSDMRDWYVWSDTPERYSDARIIFIDSEASNWTWDDQAQAYFWHRFYHFQPDLNFDNPDVREAMLDVVRHWMRMGFDGFRMDAVPYLYEREGTNGENLPETHEYLKLIRRTIDDEFGGTKVLLAEANQWPRDAAAYYGDGDECHMNFHFPVMPRLYMGLAKGHADDLREILADTPPIPDAAQWGIFLRNHDELTLEMVTPEQRDFMWDTFAPDPRMKLNLGIRRRLAPLVGGDRAAIELLHGLLFSLPGSPVMYYGDEIGMGDAYLLDDRDGVRTPMQWTAEPGAGFSTADPEAFWLPLVDDPDYDPSRVNVADQRDDPGSLLSWVRAMLAARRHHPEMGLGDFTMVETGTAAVFGFLRRLDDVTTLVVANFSRDPQAAVVDDRLVAGMRPVDTATGERLTTVGVDPIRIELGPLEFHWVSLAPR
ncbi:MAG TPA: maltose alpha-D-glucosyltransferase [Acidimicrobiia bacterium]|nr:maltose alpha-D-glucosyltransferase [Acidimicrobiia bacterium]